MTATEGTVIGVVSVAASWAIVQGIKLKVPFIFLFAGAILTTVLNLSIAGKLDTASTRGILYALITMVTGGGVMEIATNGKVKRD